MADNQELTDIGRKNLKIFLLLKQIFTHDEYCEEDADLHDALEEVGHVEKLHRWRERSDHARNHLDNQRYQENGAATEPVDRR